ncbi:1200_t:CDS:1, partial [Cetraspora pellucida]
MLRLNFPGPDNKVLHLNEISFSLKIETLSQPNYACVFFLNNDEEIDVLDGIECKDKTNNILNPQMY